jgi:mono/diheme cytochrome c family protein
MQCKKYECADTRTKCWSRAIGFAILSASSLILTVTTNAQSITKAEAELIDEGFRIFTEETFEGNGRTCGTCHVPEEQYSIGPKFINNLSSAEKDMVLAANVPGLENPTLVEDLAVFNIGLGLATIEFPEGPFRSAQQVTAVNVTTLDFSGTRQMLGWDGTGSPSGGANHGNVDENADGTLRAFANGAIAQHATATLARVAKTTACPLLSINDPDAYCGVPYDFRFATDAELDALDAFQRSLGRRAAPGTPGCGASSAGTARCTAEYIDGLDPGSKGEFTLVAFDPNVLQSGPADHEMIFSNPQVTIGKNIFQSDQGSCFLCHQNGGAHFGNNGRPHGNLTRNQGLDDFRFELSEETGINIPMDPGDPFASPAQPNAINVQTIIEAARRTRFGHNHAISGFEEMVGEGFHKPFVRDLDPNQHCVGIIGTGSPGREGLVGTSNDNHSDSEECLEEVHGPNSTNNLAAFLRAMSAWYALRDVERLVSETCDRIDLDVSTEQSVLEAEFALDDVAFVLRGSQARPTPHAKHPRRAMALKEQLRKAAGRQNKHWLRDIHERAQNLRDSIATTTQEGARVPACL